MHYHLLKEEYFRWNKSELFVLKHPSNSDVLNNNLIQIPGTLLEIVQVAQNEICNPTLGKLHTFTNTTDCICKNGFYFHADFHKSIYLFCNTGVGNPSIIKPCVMKRDITVRCIYLLTQKRAVQSLLGPPVDLDLWSLLCPIFFVFDYFQNTYRSMDIGKGVHGTAIRKEGGRNLMMINIVFVLFHCFQIKVCKSVYKLSR